MKGDRRGATLSRGARGALSRRSASDRRPIGRYFVTMVLALSWSGCVLSKELDDLTNGETPPRGSAATSRDGDSLRAEPDADTKDSAPDLEDGADAAVVGNPGTVWIDLPEPMDFGNVACGQWSPEHTALLHNQTDAAASFGVTLMGGAGSWFSVDPVQGTIDAGETVPITIRTKQVPENGGIGERTDVLQVTTSPGDGVISRGLRYTATGVVLSVSPASMAFGSMKRGSSKTRDFIVENAGNVDTTVGWMASGTAFSSSGSAVVRVDRTTKGTVKARPTSKGSKSGKLTFTSSAPVCKTSPIVSLSCTGKD